MWRIKDIVQNMGSPSLLDRNLGSPSLLDRNIGSPERKVERQVKVLIKNLAIFLLLPSKEFLLISFKKSVCLLCYQSPSPHTHRVYRGDSLESE